MKKLLLLAICGMGFFSVKTNAQSFSIPHDTIHVTVVTSANIHNDIHNDSTDAIKVSWKVTSHDFPADWGATLGICDNITCYYNAGNSLLNGSSHLTDTISAGTNGNFYVLPSLDTADPGTHYIAVNMTQGNTIKNSVYIITKFPTGIVSVGKGMDVKVYPNPAVGQINIETANAAEVKTIAVYNISGRLVLNVAVEGNTTRLNIQNLPSGNYIVKLTDTEGMVKGVTQFAKN